MSRPGFWIKRSDRLFEAESWDMICHWTKEGRVKLSDHYRTPHTRGWLEVRRDPTLSGLIPQRERLIIKRGSQEYRAPSYEVVQEWAQRGQVSPDDMIYSSYTRLWARVADLPSVMSHIPEPILRLYESVAQAALEGMDASSLVDEALEIDLSEAQTLILEATSEALVLSDEEDARKELDDLSFVEIKMPPSPEELCAPFYDAARLFIALKDLRPLDRISGMRPLVSLDLNAEGLSKREALELLIGKLETHRDHAFMQIESTSRDDLKSLYRAQDTLLNTLRQTLPLIGEVGEQRLVIGNENRPKMSHLESEAMLRLHTDLEQLIHYAREYKRSHQNIS